ncbi:LysR substrate-binding domain-containing protein [Tardiphaga sp. P9-11]|uniref:LysR substrate-binding domain-containing protein n=1 Tax=Tardiphaga sp. P9-11 TaxID=2024614 RepID=UPI0011F3042C|nr:LysR substrate-binding domain-containing protein [Tardiphaga sp. P9-11]KAA0073972.1 LysR family transcriptional regulator [Tardiphaga sp. P9-11]
MELRHLRYFVVLAEELHFARAAERLNIAAPTLTVQIQEIERTLSARLFARTKRSVALTSAGELFLCEARKVLEQHAKAVSIGQRAGRGEVGRVEIGYVGSAAYAGVLQEQTWQFLAAWQGVDLNAREVPMETLPRLITDSQVDIGFVRLPMRIPKSLRLHVLMRDRFCLALPTGHRHASVADTLRLQQLESETFITPEQTAGTYELARRGGFAPRVVAAPGSLFSVLTQVSLRAGISVIPTVACDVLRLPGVTFREIPGEPIHSEVAALFRSDEASPAVKNFIEQIRGAPARNIESSIA